MPIKFPRAQVNAVQDQRATLASTPVQQVGPNPLALVGQAANETAKVLQVKQDADDNAELTQLQGDLTDQAEDLWADHIKTADGGTIGDEKFIKDFENRYEQLSNSFLERASNDRVRSRLQTGLDKTGRFYGRKAVREQARFNLEKRIDAVGDGFNKIINSTFKNPELREENKKNISDAIEANNRFIPPEQMEALKGKAELQHDIFYIKGLIRMPDKISLIDPEGGPSFAQEVLDSEEFQTLPPATKLSLQNEIDVEKKRREREDAKRMEAERRLAASQIQDNIEDMKVKWSEGIYTDIPDSETLEQLAGDNWKVVEKDLTKFRDQTLESFSLSQEFGSLTTEEIANAQEIAQDDLELAVKGAEGFDSTDKKFTNEITQKLASEHIQARAGDNVVAYALNNEEALKDAEAARSENPTPENNQVYFDLLIDIQSKKYGRREQDILLFKKSEVEDFITTVRGATLDPSQRAVQMASALEDMDSQLGDKYRSFGFAQLIKGGLPSDARRYVNIGNAEAKQAYLEWLKRDTESQNDLIKQINAQGTGSRFSNLQQKINTKMKDIRKTATSEEVVGQDMTALVTDIATIYHGQFGMDQQKAVDLAYKQIIGDRFHVHDTWRLPKAQFPNEQNLENVKRFMDLWFDELARQHALPLHKESMFDSGKFEFDVDKATELKTDFNSTGSLIFETEVLNQDKTVSFPSDFKRPSHRPFRSGDDLVGHFNNSPNTMTDELMIVPRLADIDVRGTNLDNIKDENKKKEAIRALTVQHINDGKYFFRTSSDVKHFELYIQYDDSPIPVKVKDAFGKDISIKMSDMNEIGLRSMRETDDVEGSGFGLSDIGLGFLRSDNRSVNQRRRAEIKDEEDNRIKEKKRLDAEKKAAQQSVKFKEFDK